MIMLKCRMCGGDLRIAAGSESIAVCEFCGSVMTLPHIDDDAVLRMHLRAEEYRRTREFDQAQRLYENIAEAHPWDAEAWWGAVLCRFGIEYVRDETDGAYKPILHRMQMTSVLQDANYHQVISRADSVAREYYRRWAREIEAVNRRFLAILVNEPPFEVFISYKELDARGQRTEDSVLAQAIYDRLTREGRRVFLSRVTLEGKLGEEYEPHIFAALHSSPVMLLVGTQAEHLQSFWVKNEWSRFLHLMNQNPEKHLIPVTGGLAPDQLPRELAMLQTADFSQAGAMETLMERIRRLIPLKNEETCMDEEEQLREMIDKAGQYLLRGEYDRAADILDEAMDIDVTCSRLHLMMMQAKRHCSAAEDLTRQKDFEQDVLWQRAQRFAQGEDADFLKSLKSRADKKAEEERIRKKLEWFTEDWGESRTLVEKETLLKENADLLNRPEGRALRQQSQEEVKRMRGEFARLKQLLLNATDDELLPLLDQCAPYRDSDEYEALAAKLKQRTEPLRKKKAVQDAAADLKNRQERALYLKKRFTLHYRCDENGKAYYTGLSNSPDDRWFISDSSNPEQIQEGENVVCVADSKDLIPWAYLVEKNGTVSLYGTFEKGEKKALASARDVVSISAGEHHTALVTRDGRVLSVKKKLLHTTLEPLPWTNVVEVYAKLKRGLIARTAEGGILMEAPVPGLEAITGWSRVKHFSAHRGFIGGAHAVALTDDGRVLAAGDTSCGQCDVQKWRNVVDVEAAEGCTVALTTEGEILTAGSVGFPLDKLYGAAALFKTGPVVGAIHNDGTVCVPKHRP